MRKTRNIFLSTQIFKLLLFIGAYMTVLFMIRRAKVSIKMSNFQKSIIEKIDHEKGQKYSILGNMKRCKSDGSLLCGQEKLQSGYKLLYEIDFDCGISLTSLKEIYNFYHELSKLHNLKFCIITPIKSDSYIKFYLDKTLKNYDICVIQQEYSDDNIHLYLLDGSNRIIMAGDINLYPFLKKEYIRRFKSALQ